MVMLSVGNAGNVTSSSSGENRYMYGVASNEIGTAANNTETSIGKLKGSYTSRTTESSYNFCEELTSDAVAHSGESYISGKIRSKKSSAKMGMYSLPRNSPLIPAQDGHALIMTRKTEKITLPSKNMKVTEKYEGRNYVWLNVLKTGGISDTGMKTSVSVEDPRSNTVANIERKTDAFVETAGSDATAGSDGKCNDPDETISNSRGEQHYSDGTLNESDVTEKFLVNSQQQKLGLLPTTQGWMLLQMGETRAVSENKTDGLKSDPTGDRG
ncbi:hypothetical protein B7P43_G17158, partial [Cryptotermes secundus]